jgi:hypothetical protein
MPGSGKPHLVGEIRSEACAGVSGPRPECRPSIRFAERFSICG